MAMAERQVAMGGSTQWSLSYVISIDMRLCASLKDFANIQLDQYEHFLNEADVVECVIRPKNCGCELTKQYSQTSILPCHSLRISRG